MKRINKLISIISAMVMVLALAVFSVSASDEGIMPCSENYDTDSPICRISGSSSIIYGYRFQGNSPVTSAKITYQLQQKTGDSAWTDVSGEKYSGSTSGNYFYHTKTYSNAVSGRYYRVKVDITMYNSSGSVVESFTHFGAGVQR